MADTEKIKAVAQRILGYRQQGHQVVVVLSAMAGATNQFVEWAYQIQRVPDPREMDVLLASGEQVTVSLLAMAIKRAGFDAVSMLGTQIKILTDEAHTKARILSIDVDLLREYLSEDKVVVVAGFQGVTIDGDITTLGRGGSDTTAVALATALKSDYCEIFTDVDGVYTTDPNICASARKIDRISYNEMLELASLGAKVLDIRAVSMAKLYNVPLHVRSTFTSTDGTWVVEEEKNMEANPVSGVTYNKNEARITITRVPDTPGTAARIFTPISEQDIVVDMIIQNTMADNLTDMTFTVPRLDYKRAMEIVERLAGEIGAAGVTGHEQITKVSIVGLGMRNYSGIASTMFQALAAEGINIMMISTSEIKVSCVIEEKYTELAVRTLHDVFNLNNEQLN